MHIEKRLEYLAVIFFLLFLFTCSNTTKDWTKLEANLETELIIGDDSVYFSQPEFLVTDSNDNIIVADVERSELLVFNEQGVFMNKIGERGPGPSQFRDITGLDIHEENEVIVLDRSSQTLKKFSVSGEYLKSYKLPSAITTKTKFNSWGKYKLLFFVRPNLSLSQNYLLHIFSDSFDKEVFKSIPAQSLDGIKSEIIPLFIRHTGSHLVTENSLYFAPHMYNGFIYKYKMSESDFKLIDKFVGNSDKEPITELAHNASTYYDVSLSSPETSKKVLIHNFSKGLFQLNNDNIVHFTYVENKESTKRTFGLEVYSKGMESLGYAPFLERTYSSDPGADNLLSWEVVWKDEKDRFYIIDKENEIPKIRRVRIISEESSLESSSRF